MKLHGELDDRSEGTIGMTAMVDVVFILLSFFVLATQFRVHERDFPMGHQLAALAPGAAAEDFPKTVPVYLRNTGRGVAIAVGRAQLPDDAFDSIRAKLAEINLPDLSVTVLADPSLSVDQVSRALDAVLSSPMRNVTLARLDQPVRRPD